MNNPKILPAQWSKRGTFWLAIFALILIVGMGAAGLRRLNREGKLSADQMYFTVKRGPLRISVTESGTIQAQEQEILKNEVEGRTTILFLVPEGSRVKAGDLLVELDASELEDQKVDQQIRVQNGEAAYIRARENLEVVKNQTESDIDKAELEYEFAQQDLEKYVEGEFPKDLKEAQARITLASEELQRASEKVNWSRVLFEEKYLSQTELQGDELTANKARLDLELSKTNLTLLKGYTNARDLAELRSNVKQTEMALERTRLKASADVVQAKADLQAKESEFQQQESKLEKLGEQIKKAKIYAPMDGLVVYATSAKADWHGNSEPLDEGQEVREREELIYLPTASSFMAEVGVHESSLKKIQLDMPVRVTIDALPGKMFGGRVAKIAPLPDARSMFMNPDLKIYKTQVNLDGELEELRTGMSCQAEIIVEVHDEALYVPVQTVLRVGGKPSVYVSEGKESKQREVELGLDNNRMVRIVSGLEPGERVLLAPPLASAGVEVETLEGAEQEGKKTVAEESSPGTLPHPAGEVMGREGGAESGGARPSGPSPDNWTPEQREEMRKRFENMSDEERQAMRERWQGERGQGQGPGQGQGRRQRPAEGAESGAGDHESSS